MWGGLKPRPIYTQGLNMKVKVLRPFQDYEEGSILEIEKERSTILEQRKMVEKHEEKKFEKAEEANRSIGLKKSAKRKTEKR